MKHLRTLLYSLPKASIGLLAGFSLIFVSDQRSASALVVNVPGYGSWDITVSDTAITNLSPSTSTMPWWNDQVAANAFAEASAPYYGPEFDNLGPFFGWQISGLDVYMDAFCYGKPCFNAYGTANTVFSFNGTLADPDTINSYPWATATAVPVPGPLSILSAAPVLGYIRKLRKHIKRVKPDPLP